MNIPTVKNLDSLFIWVNHHLTFALGRDYSDYNGHYALKERRLAYVSV